MVLVILAAATGMVIKIQYNARSALARADRGFQEGRLRVAAADMARNLLQVLADDEDLLVDHWSEDWAAEFELEYPDGVTARGRIMDEQRLFDMNNLTAVRPEKAGETAERVVGEIMRECALRDTELGLDALMDWVDEDGEGQFESRYYSQKDVVYKCPDSFMLGLNELEHIAGWSRNMFKQKAEDAETALKDCLTALPVGRREPLRVNVNTAPPVVLQSILGGGNAQLVELLVSMRRDSPLRSVSIIESVVGSRRMSILEPFLDVKSRFFRINVECALNGQRERLDVLAERLADGEMQVMRWGY